MEPYDKRNYLEKKAQQYLSMEPEKKNVYRKAASQPAKQRYDSMSSDSKSIQKNKNLCQLHKNKTSLNGRN